MALRCAMRPRISPWWIFLGSVPVALVLLIVGVALARFS